jgi:hypothetical protein
MRLPTADCGFRIIEGVISRDNPLFMLPNVTTHILLSVLNHSLDHLTANGTSLASREVSVISFP